MADQNPQVNQNLNNQNENDELFWWSDDIFENSDLLQPINSEVDSAHQVVKSQNDLNNFVGEVKNDSVQTIPENQQPNENIIQNTSTDANDNQLNSDDLFENKQEEPKEAIDNFENLYNENESPDNQTQTNDFSVNDDIFDWSTADEIDEIPEIEDLAWESNNVETTDTPEVQESFDEQENISNDTSNVETPINSSEEHKETNTSANMDDDISNDLDELKDREENDFNPNEWNTDEIQQKSDDNVVMENDNLNDWKAENIYDEKDESKESEEEDDEDDFDDEDDDDFDDDEDDDDDFDEEVDDDENVDNNKWYASNKENNDNYENNNVWNVPNEEKTDDINVEETTVEDENKGQDTQENDIENIVVQDYEKYDPSQFKTDVQKKFWELQWKTEKIHELVWKDQDIWFDLLWWNDDRQKITYKILSDDDYVEIEKEELNKEDESVTTNLLEFALEEGADNNLSVKIFVNDIELYDEFNDLQKDPNKKMQVMEKMNKFIFLLDEEYKKIKKYQKEKEERNAVKWVFRNF